MKYTATYRQKNHSWQLIISFKDAEGKWRQKSRQGFARKSDAKDAEAELLQEIKKQPRPVDKAFTNITLADFCKEYLANRKSLSYATQAVYWHAVNSLQDVANKPMRNITYLDLQKAVREWNIAPATQREYRVKLRVLFKAAIKPYGIITNNPMADVEIERSRKDKKIKAIPEDVLAEILNSIKRYETYIAIRIAQFTGIRRGELAALTWDDFDFDTLTLTINKQLALTGKRQHNIVSYTKSNNGFREIPIPTTLAKELKKYRLATPLSMTGRLFPRPLALYWNMVNALNKYHYSPHCLRHTYATQLLAKGMDIRTVSALLGDHVKTVLNTYVHYNDDMRSAAAKEIEKIFATNF